MFRHKGKSRTFLHNLQLASLLSFIAGIVNVSGFLLIKTLTTNVTGHFAFFAEEVFRKNYILAIVFLCYILSFLAGSFMANFSAELVARREPRAAYLPPLLTEVIILLFIGLTADDFALNSLKDSSLISCLLLFAMGMQNSLVTKISKSTVRTTHLTGLFTDLGIDLSQLLFYREKEEQQKLKLIIWLRLSIIICFFLGCVFGGFLYQHISIKSLIVAAVILLFASLFDAFRYSYYLARRKFKERRF